MLIDTHCHLFFGNFESDLDTVLHNAKNAGVEFIIVPATDLSTAKAVVDLCDKYEQVYGAVGIHPHDCSDFNDEQLEILRTLAKHKKIVAIGEIGLDYYYDLAPKEKQIEAFRAQLDLAIELNLPVIVHNREADADIIKVLSEYCKHNLKAQLHCFSSDVDTANDLLKMGHFISFTGNVTFKNTESIRQVAKTIPPDRLLLETDSPFMTPIPHRGKRNEPAYVKLVAEKMAELHNLSVDELADITSYNVFKLFGIGKNPNSKITYPIHNSLYINVTNRCNADCVFCARKTNPVLDGFNLRLEKADEPNAESYIHEIGDPAKYQEIVFCGYGEPTIRWDMVKEIAGYVKKMGGRTRINTNGHGNVINHRNITPEMEGLIDTVSISLNATDSYKYSKIMRIEEKMYFEMLDFASKCKEFVPRVVLSAVALDEEETEKARKFTEDTLKLEFRERPLF